MLAIGVIDAQNDFMLKSGALYVPNAEKIIPVIASVCNFAERVELPLFFTTDEHDGTEPEMSKNGGPFPLHCMKNTLGQQLVVEPSGDPVFPKRCYNVFDPDMGNPEIARWLDEMGIKHVLLCGVVGNICVQAAAMGMIDKGINVTILDAATAWMDLPDNTIETARFKMRLAGIRFTSRLC
jgi:nicotinamidase/pyrazinamidase